MVKVVARNRAGSFQRLVVMSEQEYEELRAASLLQKKTGSDNSLVDKYLGDNVHPELSTSERLALYNQAVAREETLRQFTQGRNATSTTSTLAPKRMDVPDTMPPLVNASDTAQAAEADTTQAAEADDKIEEAQEQNIKTDELANPLPDVRVPITYGPKLATLKTILQSSSTVSVDGKGRVYIDRTLLDDKSNYFDLMRSLFVNPKKDAKLAGRTRFLEHLHKLGVSAKHVSTRSAKAQLQQLLLQPKQVGGKRHTKGSRPPGKRPKVLLMYR
jgi:hypothetical protein